MILVDSSVWIDHFRKSDATLAALLASRVVVCHPFVVGELALGRLARRDEVLDALGRLPAVRVVPHDEVLAFVRGRELAGRGIGWVDAHLLASTLVGGALALWSRDRRLAAAAAACGVAYPARTD